ncbi:MAG: ABC transporter permease, partial [Cyclobacteriaceae bacterium]
MLKNYLKVAYRNLFKYKGYAIINILGLAVGLATSMLIFLWVADEVSYDKFHEKGDRLYRVMEDHIYADQFFTIQSSPAGLAELLEAEIPEIENVTRATWNREVLLSVGEQGFSDNGFYVDPDFLQMFSFEVVEGSAESALQGTYNIVLTRELAEKLFPGESPIGKTVTINEVDDYKVTAVVADLPANSTIRFKFLLPFEAFLSQNDWLNDLGNNSIRTYVLTYQSDQLKQVNEKIRMILKDQDEGSVVEIFLQSIQDIHLHNVFTETVRAGGRIEYVRLFTFIGILIILIACINFMNLSTARSARRAREVGVRKVVGANKYMLIGQFIGESFLIVVMAAVVAIIAVLLILPAFNELTDKEIAIPYTEPLFYVYLFILLGLTALLSGAYPAFFLSRFSMISVLKGGMQSGKGAAIFRKGLVVFQFALSIALIIGTFVITRQVHFIKNKNLGLERENVVYFLAPQPVKDRFATFKEEALSLPGVEQMALTSELPINVGMSTQEVGWRGKDPEASVLFQYLTITPGVVETFGMQMKKGRVFDDRITDTASVILNEEAVKRMQLEDPVGEVITFWEEDKTVIGVVKDFHNKSLHETIEPLIMTYQSGKPSSVVARIDGSRLEETLT